MDWTTSGEPLSLSLSLSLGEVATRSLQAAAPRDVRTTVKGPSAVHPRIFLRCCCCCRCNFCSCSLLPSCERFSRRASSSRIYIYLYVYVPVSRAKEQVRQVDVRAPLTRGRVQLIFFMLFLSLSLFSDDVQYRAI